MAMVNAKLSAATMTLTSMTSGLVVWGIPLSLFLQTAGFIVAVVTAVISALFLLAMYVEKCRSNRKNEELKARELDILEGK